jgi:hypothetical protein
LLIDHIMCIRLDLSGVDSSAKCNGSSKPDFDVSAKL